MTRILVIDDHPLIARGLTQVFGSGFSLTSAANRARAEAELERTDYDVCILDVSLGPEDGLSLLGRVRAGVPAFVLSMHANPHYARLARSAGAKGYFTKDEDLSLLRRAVMEPEERPFWCSAEMQAALDASVDRKDGPYESLTVREQEVFRLLAEGRNYKEIAFSLSISAKTVNVHRGSIFAKMGLSSQSELVKEGIRLGVVDL